MSHNIFKEIDKRIFQRNISQRNEMGWGKLEGDDEIETAYVFEATVDTIIKRLEVMGYTLKACKNDFQHRIKEELKNLKSIEEYDIDFVYAQRDIYSKFGSFETWLNAFNTIRTEKIETLYYFDNPKKVHSNELINYMVNPSSTWNEDAHLCGFEYPCLDFNLFSRVFLETCEPDQMVQLDATDLVLGGWYDGFEHLEDFTKPNTRFYAVLRESFSEIEELIKDGSNSTNERLLSKLLYANVITVFETYLSDTFVHTVISFPPLIRRVVENDPEFSKRKIDVSDLFRRHDSIEIEVAEYLNGLIYHNLPKIKELYRSTLCVNFPKNLSAIFKAIEIRHDIVHRNGKNKQGDNHELDLTAVTNILNTIVNFADTVDLQVKNVYPMMLEIEL